LRLLLLTTRSSFVAISVVGLDSGNDLCCVLNVSQAVYQELKNLPISKVQAEHGLQFSQITVEKNSTGDCVFSQNRRQLFYRVFQLVHLREQSDEIFAAQFGQPRVRQILAMTKELKKNLEKHRSTYNIDGNFLRLLLLLKAAVIMFHNWRWLI
jgi:hypothetical protein